jgi:probable rRNA maturation factor
MTHRNSHKINIFLENNKWLDKTLFKSKRDINKLISNLSKTTINECFLQPKFKKFKNLKTNVNFILTDDKFLKKLNTDFLNKKRTTNVLSFPNDNFFKYKENFLGEVFLSYESCKKDATKFKINCKARISHLIIHGTLHLLGYDHETKENEKKMIGIELKILNSLGTYYY